MPGTTRYSATFDRPYEEEERPASDPSNGSRRSRSQSWQANMAGDARPYTPLGNNRPPPRSSSTDSGAKTGAEHIPTRTVSKTVVKTHNNPFQFVKVGSCPLYKKAEEQLKKVKEVKKPEVLKEEEEEWQSNLDSWKSRRRKMSEDVFRRQEEIRQFEQEQEEQCLQAAQKKTKTFSEMVESRANRGRTLSLCLISSPLELQEWEIERNKSNSSHPFSEGSEENSAVNSEDEGVGDKRAFQKNLWSNCTNENGHSLKNGSTNGCRAKSNETNYADSGLESISSSHRMGDTPDSCSDFSQDSGSSIDCDSPRVSGLLLNSVNLLEDFNSKSLSRSDCDDAFLNSKSDRDIISEKDGTEINKKQDCLHEEAQVPKANVNPNSTSMPSDTKVSDSNSIESCTPKSFSNAELENSIEMSSKLERSIESENEVFVDDFEELNANAKIFTPNSPNATVPLPLKSPSVPSICSNSEKTSNNSAADLVVDPTSLREKGKMDKVEKKAVPQPQNLGEKVVSNVEKKPELHSQENEITEASNQKKPKNVIRRKKKKATAKIVSVEISNEKTDSSIKKEATSASPQIDEKSLNIVFQSQPLTNKDAPSNSPGNSKTSPTVCVEKIALNDVTPVEKIAEEMEKLILQQLEEEERAKEMSSKVQTTDLFGSPDHNLIAPPKVSEPPKEKPPPPPVVENEAPKTAPLKRVNSTKRIKKEIHKRRSNFLGIENADENVACGECIVPPPPALEEVLKAEMELDRENRKRLESATEQRLKLEECEIMQKEQEIIANLESEERQRLLINNAVTCDIMQEEDRIQKMKEERMKMENDRLLAETQRLRLEEQKQLRDKAEFLRKQEADNAPSTEISAPVLSDAANLSNKPKSPNASSSCLETKPNVSLSGIGGEGGTISNSSSQPLDHKSSETKEKPSVPIKPAVPPKPLKKKEAIRKERERLRQEQEALQREREEHRQKLIKEQEKLHPKPYAPNAPVSRLGPVPPLKPSYNPQLTNPIGTQPSARENVIFTSQSFQGAQNGISSTSGCVDPVLNKQSKPILSQKKTVHNEPWIQQKVSPVKKQPLDASPESKYNQNHWLIQEAEMRRIAELKERQHSVQFPIPQTHLAEDDVCSTSPRAPVVSPTALVNAPLQDKVWSYGHSNMTLKKYPPPVTAEKPVGLCSVPPQPPAKPSRVVPMERPEHMLSVSGRKRCSHCSEELGRGAAMIIESLQLYYHIHCFQCCVCQAQLGNGSCGTDVRVRNNKLHCHNCYSNDEAGLKFSQV